MLALLALLSLLLTASGRGSHEQRGGHGRHEQKGGKGCHGHPGGHGSHEQSSSTVGPVQTTSTVGPGQKGTTVGPVPTGGQPTGPGVCLNGVEIAALCVHNTAFGQKMSAAMAACMGPPASPSGGKTGISYLATLKFHLSNL